MVKSVGMWTRRRFLEATSASAALTASPTGLLLGQQRPQSQRNSPEVIAGRYVPLLHENVARPLRYLPEDGAFHIRNGKQFFNRPLYGPNIPFRADGGDLPEFSLYLPGHGGNIRLGVASQHSGRSKWFFEFETIVASYDAGGSRLRAAGSCARPLQFHPSAGSYGWGGALAAGRSVG